MTTTNSAFWEAVTLVGIVLVALIASTIHVNGLWPQWPAWAPSLPGTSTAKGGPGGNHGDNADDNDEDDEKKKKRRRRRRSVVPDDETSSTSQSNDEQIKAPNSDTDENGNRRGVKDGQQENSSRDQSAETKPGSAETELESAASIDVDHETEAETPSTSNETIPSPTTDIGMSSSEDEMKHTERSFSAKYTLQDGREVVIETPVNSGKDKVVLNPGTRDWGDNHPNTFKYHQDRKDDDHPGLGGGSGGGGFGGGPAISNSIGIGQDGSTGNYTARQEAGGQSQRSFGYLADSAASAGPGISGFGNLPYSIKPPPQIQNNINVFNAGLPEYTPEQLHEQEKMRQIAKFRNLLENYKEPEKASVKVSTGDNIPEVPISPEKEVLSPVKLDTMMAQKKKEEVAFEAGNIKANQFSPVRKKVKNKPSRLDLKSAIKTQASDSEVSALAASPIKQDKDDSKPGVKAGKKKAGKVKLAEELSEKEGISPSKEKSKDLLKEKEEKAKSKKIEVEADADEVEEKAKKTKKTKKSKKRIKADVSGSEEISAIEEEGSKKKKMELAASDEEAAKSKQASHHEIDNKEILKEKKRKNKKAKVSPGVVSEDASEPVSGEDGKKTSMKTKDIQVSDNEKAEAKTKEKNKVTGKAAAEVSEGVEIDTEVKKEKKREVKAAPEEVSEDASEALLGVEEKRKLKKKANLEVSEEESAKVVTKEKAKVTAEVEGSGDEIDPKVNARKKKQVKDTPVALSEEELESVSPLESRKKIKKRERAAPSEDNTAGRRTRHQRGDSADYDAQPASDEEAKVPRAQSRKRIARTREKGKHVGDAELTEMEEGADQTAQQKIRQKKLRLGVVYADESDIMSPLRVWNGPMPRSRTRRPEQEHSEQPVHGAEEGMEDTADPLSQAALVQRMRQRRRKVTGEFTKDGIPGSQPTGQQSGKVTEEMKNDTGDPGHASESEMIVSNIGQDLDGDDKGEVLNTGVPIIDVRKGQTRHAVKQDSGNPGISVLSEDSVEKIQTGSKQGVESEQCHAKAGGALDDLKQEDEDSFIKTRDVDGMRQARRDRQEQQRLKAEELQVNDTPKHTDFKKSQEEIQVSHVPLDPQEQGQPQEQGLPQPQGQILPSTDPSAEQSQQKKGKMRGARTKRRDGKNKHVPMSLSEGEGKGVGVINYPEDDPAVQNITETSYVGKHGQQQEPSVEKLVEINNLSDQNSLTAHAVPTEGTKGKQIQQVEQEDQLHIDHKNFFGPGQAAPSPTYLDESKPTVKRKQLGKDSKCMAQKSQPRENTLLNMDDFFGEGQGAPSPTYLDGSKHAARTGKLKKESQTVVEAGEAKEDWLSNNTVNATPSNQSSGKKVQQPQQDKEIIIDHDNFFGQGEAAPSPTYLNESETLTKSKRPSNKNKGLIEKNQQQKKTLVDRKSFLGDVQAAPTPDYLPATTPVLGKEAQGKEFGKEEVLVSHGGLDGRPLEAGRNPTPGAKHAHMNKLPKTTISTGVQDPGANSVLETKGGEAKEQLSNSQGEVEAKAANGYLAASKSKAEEFDPAAQLRKYRLAKQQEERRKQSNKSNMHYEQKEGNSTVVLLSQDSLHEDNSDLIEAYFTSDAVSNQFSGIPEKASKTQAKATPHQDQASKVIGYNTTKNAQLSPVDSAYWSGEELSPKHGSGQNQEHATPTNSTHHTSAVDSQHFETPSTSATSLIKSSPRQQRIQSKITDSSKDHPAARSRKSNESANAATESQQEKHSLPGSTSSIMQNMLRPHTHEANQKQLPSRLLHDDIVAMKKDRHADSGYASRTPFPPQSEFQPIPPPKYGKMSKDLANILKESQDTGVRPQETIHYKKRKQEEQGDSSVSSKHLPPHHVDMFEKTQQFSHLPEGVETQPIRMEKHFSVDSWEIDSPKQVTASAKKQSIEAQLKRSDDLARAQASRTNMKQDDDYTVKCEEGQNLGGIITRNEDGGLWWEEKINMGHKFGGLADQVSRKAEEKSHKGKYAALDVEVRSHLDQKNITRTEEERQRYRVENDSLLGKAKAHMDAMAGKQRRQSNSEPEQSDDLGHEWNTENTKSQLAKSTRDHLAQQGSNNNTPLLSNQKVDAKHIQQETNDDVMLEPKAKSQKIPKVKISPKLHKSKQDHAVSESPGDNEYQSVGWLNNKHRHAKHQGKSDDPAEQSLMLASSPEKPQSSRKTIVMENLDDDQMPQSSAPLSERQPDNKQQQQQLNSCKGHRQSSQTSLSAMDVNGMAAELQAERISAEVSAPVSKDVRNDKVRQKLEKKLQQSDNAKKKSVEEHGFSSDTTAVESLVAELSSEKSSRKKRTTLEEEINRIDIRVPSRVKDEKTAKNLYPTRAGHNNDKASDNNLTGDRPQQMVYNLGKSHRPEGKMAKIKRTVIHHDHEGEFPLSASNPNQTLSAEEHKARHSNHIFTHCSDGFKAMISTLFMGGLSQGLLRPRSLLRLLFAGVVLMSVFLLSRQLLSIVHLSSSSSSSLYYQGADVQFSKAKLKVIASRLDSNHSFILLHFYMMVIIPLIIVVLYHIFNWVSTPEGSRFKIKSLVTWPYALFMLLQHLVPRWLGKILIIMLIVIPYVSILLAYEQVIKAATKRFGNVSDRTAMMGINLIFFFLTMPMVYAVMEVWELVELVWRRVSCRT